MMPSEANAQLQNRETAEKYKEMMPSKRKFANVQLQNCVAKPLLFLQSKNKKQR